MSVGCKGLDEGCLWAEFDLPGVGGGTSISAPQVGAALASVLAVFPDTTHQNLAKFAKACARKSGQGIEVLLRESGGVGVADFTCMGGVTQALADLPVGGTTHVAINGQTVAVGGRSVIPLFTLSTPYAQDGIIRWKPREYGESEYSFNIMPTGGEHSMLVGIRKEGDLFVSAAVGTMNDFFGFSGDHEDVRVLRLTAGHENLFAHFSEAHSTGGRFIESAEGRSLGVTARKGFGLTEESTLDFSMQTERFIGGSAAIGLDGVSFGNVRLEGSDWSHRINLRSRTDIGERESLDVSANMHLLGAGESSTSVNIRYRMAF